MIFPSLSISIIFFILLSTNIHALRDRSIRHRRADECALPNDNACGFVNCENGGQCIEDPTTSDCYKCQCQPGFTGKVCDTSIAILPTGCLPGCENGGVCNVNVCLCPGGYTGAFCETRNYCLPSNPCQNGGRCTSTGATYLCDCLGTGYTGTACTELITSNPCTSNPCQNGGQCSPNGASMNCICVNGYSGIFCQIPPVPCATIPCENGGKCELIVGNTYGCVCPEQFTGTRCETFTLATHPCVTMATTVCQNGGVCTVNGLDYLCNCTAGWSGRNCQIQETIRTCNPSPCGSHGTCLEGILSNRPIAICNCEDRWTGKYCDVNMDINCPGGYCLSGGTCRMNGNVPYCDCPPLYTGQQCESLVGVLTTTTTISTSVIVPGIGSCLPNPCMNGGTCFSSSNSYICQCVLPWSGPRCSTPENTTPFPLITTTPMLTTTTISTGNNVCAQNPCFNGGACYASTNSFMCICITPFTGKLCETTQPTTMPLITTTGVAMACADQPCKNGGTCVPMGASYSCFCGTNSIYSGKNCDSTTPMPVDECPLECAPGRCIFSGNPQKPYACLWNGIMRPTDGTTG